MDLSLSEEAKEARRAYQREWNKANPGAKQRHANAYWERRAQKLMVQEALKAEPQSKGGAV